jgi:hypothetical protein
MRLFFNLQQPLPHLGDDVKHAARLFEASIDCFFKSLRVSEHLAHLEPALQGSERLAKVVKLQVALFQIDLVLGYWHDWRLGSASQFNGWLGLILNERRFVSWDTASVAHSIP